MTRRGNTLLWSDYHNYQSRWSHIVRLGKRGRQWQLLLWVSGRWVFGWRDAFWVVYFGKNKFRESQWQSYSTFMKRTRCVWYISKDEAGRLLLSKSQHVAVLYACVTHVFASCSVVYEVFGYRYPCADHEAQALGRTKECSSRLLKWLSDLHFQASWLRIYFHGYVQDLGTMMSG